MDLHESYTRPAMVAAIGNLAALNLGPELSQLLYTVLAAVIAVVGEWIRRKLQK